MNKKPDWFSIVSQIYFMLSGYALAIFCAPVVETTGEKIAHVAIIGVVLVAMIVCLEMTAFFLKRFVQKKKWEGE